MKVKELIAELAKHDPEMEVFLYSADAEGDAGIEFIHEVGTHMYCKGDSRAEEYLAWNPGKRALMLHDNSWALNDDLSLREEYTNFEFVGPGPWTRINDNWRDEEGNE